MKNLVSKGLLIVSLVIFGLTSCKKQKIEELQNFEYKDKLFSAITTDFTRGQTTVDFLNELGVNFVNFRMTFAWEKIEPQKGEFDWEEADAVVNIAYENGISLMPMIFSARGVMGGDAGGYSSTYGVPHGSNIGINDEDIDGYRNFVYQTVNRYKDKIKYWQFWEEASSQARNDPEGYAQAFKITYEEIKRADPEAKVVIGQFLVNQGDISVSKEYFEIVFNYLGQEHYFDVFEFLYSPPDNDKEGYKDIESIGSEIREFINQYGYSDIPLFFSTTAGTNSLTENEQAEQIIRLYASGASSNLFSRIMWDELYGCWSVGGVSMERGLVWCASAKKKLGYYTYKLMSEKLEGSDWNNVETVQESDNVYIYKFTNQDRHIWVVWWDYWNESGNSKTITLDVSSINSVKIT